MELTTEFKHKVRSSILEHRENFGGSDSAFAKSLGINAAAYSRIKGGEVDRIISDTNWLSIGNQLQVTMRANTWKVARTKVYAEIEDNLHTCKEQSQSMILVDDCGIGKPFCARHILRKMRNAFYVDCSQAKTRIQFVKLLAKVLGVDQNGKHVDVKSNIKYALNILELPLIVLDEAGDLEYSTLMVVKELWNATENNVGWYMMGADGLRSKMKKCISNSKVGFAELFSRFSENFITLTPQGSDNRRKFYAQLIGDVAFANAKDANINELINKTYDKVEARHRSLRNLKTLIQIA